MRFAYADPPYPGQSHQYKGHKDYAGEVDHRKLIHDLEELYPQGWALSTNSNTLKFVLSLCPDSIRILSWCKPHPPLYPGAGHLMYAWEPVILAGGRKIKKGQGQVIYDFVVASAAFTSREPTFIGRKPSDFCFWLFRCLGALPGDELVDLFPGSGAVSRAWDKYQRQIPLTTAEPEAAPVQLDLLAGG